MNKYIIFMVLTIFLMRLVSATQSCEVYDDFTSQTLNTDKWEELIGRSGGGDWIDEHSVDATNQNYHTAQLSQADKGVELKALHTFQAGETLEFDLIYNYGSGNHWGCAFWDETSSWQDGLSCIGYWNGINSYNGEYGTYHFKISYTDKGADREITLPDGSSIGTWFYSNIEAPYTFSVVSRTGHNGLLHFDYDNFKICREIEDVCDINHLDLCLDENSCNNVSGYWYDNICNADPNELEKRIIVLEERIEELENRTSLLESVINKIVEFIRNLPKGLSKNWIE